MKILLAFCSLALFVQQTGTALKASNYRYAYAISGCAPWDEPAVQIYLSNKEAKENQPQTPYLSIFIYKSGSEIVGRTFELGTGSELGQASFCRARYKCRSAISATVKITSVDSGKYVSGQYSLSFQNGTRIEGVFDAKWIQVIALCG